jgi:hypothetical protein
MNCKSWFKTRAVGTALLAAAASAWALDRGQIDAAVDQRLAAAVADLQAWVRIPSVTEAGDPHRADKVTLLRAVVARAGELALDARLLAGEQVAVVELGQGENALGILVHADVVPAGDPTRWQHPPFSGELVDGAVWGRGSLDDKGPLVASLYALAALTGATSTRCTRRVWCPPRAGPPTRGFRSSTPRKVTSKRWPSSVAPLTLYCISCRAAPCQTRCRNRPWPSYGAIPPSLQL